MGRWGRHFLLFVMWGITRFRTVIFFDKLSYVLNELPMLGQFLDLISAAKINLLKPRFELTILIFASQEVWNKNAYSKMILAHYGLDASLLISLKW